MSPAIIHEYCVSINKINTAYVLAVAVIAVGSIGLYWAYGNLTEPRVTSPECEEDGHKAKIPDQDEGKKEEGDKDEEVAEDKTAEDKTVEDEEVAEEVSVEKI